jgi:hypothetical protein
MLIHVAAQTIARKAKEAAVQLANDYSLSFPDGNVLGLVALFTFQLSVPPFEKISRLAVVKLLLAGLPADQGKVLAIVLGVTRNAVFAARVVGENSGVIPAPLGEPLPDLRVAVQAFQFRLAQAHSVALDALRGSIQ